MKPLPDIETAKQEALDVIRESLGRFGEILDHQWVGRSIGTPSDLGYDLKLRYRVAKGPGRGKEWWIHAIIKTVVHPKQASHAIWHLQKSSGKTVGNDPVYPILIAPFISDSVAARCEEKHIGHLDLSGNCNIEFGGIWIERNGRPRKYKEQRGSKSLFTPKASRILRVLLQGPLESYLVNVLAFKAKVSLGHVSKVRRLLLNEDLAEETKAGIRIKDPDGILEQWVQEDSLHRRIEIREYSSLGSPATLAESLAVFCGENRATIKEGPLFTLNFAAALRAPHNVANTVSAYLPEFPNDELLSSLHARSLPGGGGNLRIFVPDDYYGVGLGCRDVGGLRLVSDLQLYLDLQAGEPNGEEQADVLRQLEDFNGGWS